MPQDYVLEHFGVKGMKWGVRSKYREIAGMAYGSQGIRYDERRLQSKVDSYVGYELRDRIFKLKGREKKLVALVQTKKGIKRVNNVVPRLAKLMKKRMTIDDKMEAKREEIRQLGKYDQLLEQKITKNYKTTMDVLSVVVGSGTIYY